MRLNRCKDSDAFTLLETILAAVIAMALLAVGAAWAWSARHQAMRRQAQAEIARMEIALERWRARHGQPPVPCPEQSARRAMRRALFEPDGGSPPLLAESRFRIENGEILDPWGRPYVFQVGDTGWRILSCGQDEWIAEDDIHGGAP